MKYKVISFDIFQTLVNVNKRIPEIWRGILKEKYTDEKAEQGAKAVLCVLPEVYEDAVHSEQFQNMEKVYLNCAQRVSGRLGFKTEPDKIAYHLMYQHSRAPFYQEVLDCLAKLKNQYQIILSSDSNHLMVDELINNVAYDEVFISDDLKCYKGDPKGKFFDTVLHKINVKPQEIIHIGDSSADVLGAHKAGITSCWLNRNNRQWKNTVKPDFIIEDITGLFDIL